MTFAEDADSLPEGWVGMNEWSGYDADESVVFLGNARSQIVCNFPSSAFEGLNQGQGPIARYLGVEGVPGNYNILEYLIPGIVGQVGTPQGPGWIMSPGIAQSLWDYGLESKEAVGTWLNDNTIMPIGEIEKWGWYDFNYRSGERTTMVNGEAVMLKDLPDDYLYKWLGSRASIIVCNSFGDETIILFGNMGGSARPIDPWR